MWNAKEGNRRIRSREERDTACDIWNASEAGYSAFLGAKLERTARVVCMTVGATSPHPGVDFARNRNNFLSGNWSIHLTEED